MKKYPNATNEHELKLLESIDSEKYCKDKMRELLGGMFSPKSSQEDKIKLGTIREDYAKGNITDRDYVMSLRANDVKNPNLSNHINSIVECSISPNEYNLANKANNDVFFMRGGEAKGHEVALAITHNIINSTGDKNISFGHTHKNLSHTFKNANIYLEDENHNHIRDAMVRNPKGFTDAPIDLSIKEGKEHPMMAKIWKSLDIDMDFKEKMIKSSTFNRFPEKTKENQISKLQYVSKVSWAIFGNSDKIEEKLKTSNNALKKIKKSNNISFNR